MRTIENPRQIIRYDQRGMPVAKLDMQVGEFDELPALGEEVDGYIVAAGSISQVVKEGCWCTLEEDGWYDDDGNAVEVGG